MLGLKQKWKHSVNVLVLPSSKETSMGVQSALLTDIKVESKFVGYTELTHDSELFVIIQGDALVNEASAGTAELNFC